MSETVSRIVGWMIGDPNDHPAMYNAQQQEQAFDAAKRWNSPITALVAHPSTPEFAHRLPQEKV